jgi:hypothetical protein
MMEFAVAVFVVLLFFFGVFLGSNEVEKEAFERGHMVECIGKSGYYWECK